MTDEYTLMLSAKLPADEYESGLAAFKAAVAAMPLTAFSVSHEDGKISVRGDVVSDSGGDELYDRVVAAMLEAFPSLDDAITYEDPVLGFLNYRDEQEGFEGSIQLGDEEDIELVLRCPPEPASPALLARGRDLVTRWPEWSQLIGKRIVADLLDLYNNEWHTLDENADPDGGPLSSDAFLARLTVSSLTVNEDFSVDLYFDSDWMFTEHGVSVQLSPEDEIRTSIQ